MPILPLFKIIFALRIIHRENLLYADFPLFSVFLIYIIHRENVFSTSIIHFEKAPPEKIFRLQRVNALSPCKTLKKKYRFHRENPGKEIGRKKAGEKYEAFAF